VIDFFAAHLLALDLDREQQEGCVGLLVGVVGLVPFEKSKREEESRDAHLLLSEASVVGDLLH